MVSTRHHPRAFPEPDAATSRSPRSGASPTSSTTATPATSKRSGRSRSVRRKTIDANTFEPPTSPSEGKALARAPSTRAKSTRRSRRYTYEHYVPSWVLVWLFVSLPLVTWDTLYVLGRPHTMPGGKFANPIWTPYALYGTIDYIYGFPQWNIGNGFTAAQGSMNILETIMYTYYLYVIATSIEGGWRNVNKGVFHKIFREDVKGKLLIRGRRVPEGMLVGFAAAVMTVSKTILYWLNEAFSNFANVGHNSWNDLFWLWIIPNGAWMVVPSFMIYRLGKEILNIMHGNQVKEE